MQRVYTRLNTLFYLNEKMIVYVDTWVIYLQKTVPDQQNLWVAVVSLTCFQKRKEKENAQLNLTNM